MIRVRRIAIVFAVASTLYWLAVASFVGVLSPLAGLDVAPYWLVALAGVLPAALYAVVTLFFCHWLARRVHRAATKTAAP